jgi:hypothetical protein
MMTPCVIDKLSSLPIVRAESVQRREEGLHFRPSA